ncbi:hypothetical protein RB195_007888 [Necator americanus]|uniref:Uncharacterized protein n=1 Tax=Necator americanus TaxID=51031 RepID=A0ABR1C353_NECAM
MNIKLVGMRRETRAYLSFLSTIHDEQTGGSSRSFAPSTPIYSVIASRNAPTAPHRPSARPYVRVVNVDANYKLSIH